MFWPLFVLQSYIFDMFNIFLKSFQIMTKKKTTLRKYHRRRDKTNTEQTNEQLLRPTQKRPLKMKSPMKSPYRYLKSESPEVKRFHDVHCMFKMYEHHSWFISHNIYIYQIINQRMFHLLLFLRVIAEHYHRICVKTKHNEHKN